MAKTDFQVRVLGSAVFVCLLLGLGSALTSVGLASWYQTLVLPSYAPPGAIIGLVWTTLYALLAVAIVLSWIATDKVFWKSVGPLYIVNGMLNVLWSFVFFVLHDLSGAAVTAGLLACSVLVLIFANLKPSKAAAILLVPYFLWTSFATGLNVHITVLNLPKETESPTLPKPEQRPDENISPSWSLMVGATKIVDEHLSLTLDRINDSRCPVDDGVVCIWAGELSPELTVWLDGKISQIRLGTTTAKEIDIGQYHLTLVDAGLESAKFKVTIK